MDQHRRPASDSTDSFLLEMIAARPVAVVGASRHREKFGNIVLRNLRGRGWTVYAVNPHETEIEGQPAWPTLAELPEPPGLVVVVTPPAVSLSIVEQAADLGLQRVWLQPGAEDEQVIARAGELGLRLAHNACVMVLAARAG